VEKRGKGVTERCNGGRLHIAAKDFFAAEATATVFGGERGKEKNLAKSLSKKMFAEGITEPKKRKRCIWRGM